MVHLICFRLEIPFLAKFGPKDQNCQFRLKFELFQPLALNLFWAYLVRKFKFVCSGKNLLPRLFEYAKFNDGVLCICFRLETPFLGKFGPKKENCKFRLRFDTQCNSNMKNSMVMLTLFIFQRYFFLCQICFKKSKLCVEAEIWNPD